MIFCAKLFALQLGFLFGMRGALHAHSFLKSRIVFEVLRTKCYHKMLIHVLTGSDRHLKAVSDSFSKSRSDFQALQDFIYSNNLTESQLCEFFFKTNLVLDLAFKSVI